MWACPARLKNALAGRAFRSVAAAEKRRQATRLQSLTQKPPLLATVHSRGAANLPYCASKNSDFARKDDGPSKKMNIQKCLLRLKYSEPSSAILLWTFDLNQGFKRCILRLPIWKQFSDPCRNHRIREMKMHAR